MSDTFPHRYVVNTPSGQTWAGSMRCSCGKTDIPPVACVVGETQVLGDDCPDALRKALMVCRVESAAAFARMIGDHGLAIMGALELGAAHEHRALLAWLREDDNCPGGPDPTFDREVLIREIEARAYRPTPKE